MTMEKTLSRQQKERGFFRKQLRLFYERFVSLQGDPRHIARGMALGVFIGTTPTIPLHTVLVLGLGLLFRQHIAAGYLGSWLISNPLTIPILYVLQYELGIWILGMPHQEWVLNAYSLQTIQNLGWRILLPLQTGGLMMALVLVVPVYVLALRLAMRVRRGGTP
jgi:uncharacterized protein (DUF2062 family)